MVANLNPFSIPSIDDCTRIPECHTELVATIKQINYTIDWARSETVAERENGYIVAGLGSIQYVVDR